MRRYNWPRATTVDRVFQELFAAARAQAPAVIEWSDVLALAESKKWTASDLFQRLSWATSHLTKPIDDRSLYFVRSEPTGAIKIGVSGNPKQRIKQLGIQSPVPLTLLATVPGCGRWGGGRAKELFKKFHLRGEWYEPAPPLLAVIYDLRSLCSVSP